MDIEEQIKENLATGEKLLPLVTDIERIAGVLSACLGSGNKILIAGNGGSAADSQHMAAELVGRFKKERRALPAIALTTDTSILTAWPNDYNFESVFERQIEALGRQGDIFIGMSTSGNSENILRAVNKAEQLGMEVILLLGRDGGKLKEMSNNKIIVPSNETPRIQEGHILIIHMLCDYIENALFS